MAEQPKGKGGGQMAMDTVRTAKDAAKLLADVGRIFAGDFSAAIDILKNKLFWEIVLCVTVAIALIGLILGASFTGLLEYVSRLWEENWNENWMEQGVISNGSLDYLETKGWTNAVVNTMGDTVKDTIDAGIKIIKNVGLALGIGKQDNSQITDPDIIEAGRNPDGSDIDRTMQAITDGAVVDDAILDRLEMIKGRVKQRGLQIRNAVRNQYITSNNSEYRQLIESLQDNNGKPVHTNTTVTIYAGFDQETSENYLYENLNLEVFDLTDLQALKILAIFSVQHDCSLNNIDMWTLMNYCGWYTKEYKGDMEDLVDSIYQVPQPTQHYGSMSGSELSGLPIPLATYEFEPLRVPIWEGTCAPQWYYDEAAQLRQKYGNDFDISQMNKLGQVQTFGIVDRLFYIDENNITVARRTWNGHNFYDPENYSGSILEDYGSTVYNLLEEYVWARSKNGSILANDIIVRRTKDGEHLCEINIRLPEDRYIVDYDEETGEYTEYFGAYWLILYKADDLINPVAYLRAPNNEQVFHDLEGNTKYIVQLAYQEVISHFSAEHEAIETRETWYTDPNEFPDPIYSSVFASQDYAEFTTFVNQKEVIVYKMTCAIDISIKARTVDEIAFDLLGIWPSNLYDTSETIGYTKMSNNLIGKSSLGDAPTYYYNFSGGMCEMIDKSATASRLYSDGKFLDTHRSTSEKQIDDLEFVTTTYEYAVTKGRNGLSNVESRPTSGWKQVSSDGADLTFSLGDGTSYYSAYVRITRTEISIDERGNQVKKVYKWLYKLDEIGPVSKGHADGLYNVLASGSKYAREHFGKFQLSLEWYDWIGNQGYNQIKFTRQTPNQYETYVDMVMSLCELLNDAGYDISYEGWEPALERAEELKLSSSG